ncbi:MAG: nicotinate-nucleotide--dimethylbenzimidazole phosphoribosyltransferase [Methyloligellaceae bacterium]
MKSDATHSPVMTAAVPLPDWWEEVGVPLEKLPPPDEKARRGAKARQQQLTKPPGSLGRLEDIAIWLAGWQGREIPKLERVQALVFAGNHGVTAQDVSPYPASVTAQMVENFRRGGAAICQLCAAYQIDLDVIALSLDSPTGDITESEAMTPEGCIAALRRGMAAVPGHADALVLGEMGIGNTTIAAALAHALLGGRAQDWAGPGTGLDAQGISRKAAAVAASVERHVRGDLHPFEILRRLGGREIAALCGAMLQARLNRIPVFLDGYVAGAAALVLARAQRHALAHCIASHVSAEPGHRRMLEALSLAPLLDLGMRLGEGTGAALALGLARGAVAAHAGMATFAQAGVDGRK